MGVKRLALAFEGKFVQIPNEWVRDERLSRRARGLLAEIMSHRVGWHISIAALQKAGTEGRDAIRSALTELMDAGYLRRVQSRGGHGRFNEVEYELCEPVTADGKPVSGGFTVSGSTDSGLPDVGESDTKNTIYKEDQFLEHDSLRSEASSPPTKQSSPFEQHVNDVTNSAYAAIDKAANFMALRGIAKWCIKERSLDGEQFRNACVAIYGMGKPITRQTVGQFLDGHLTQPRPNPRQSRMQANLQLVRDLEAAEQQGIEQ